MAKRILTKSQKLAAAMYQRQWRKEHPGYNKEYTARNPEKWKAYQRAGARKNKKYIKQRQAKYYKAHKKEHAARMKEGCAKNRDALNAYYREYYKKHNAKLRAYHRARYKKEK